jgi:hypothetical protein
VQFVRGKQLASGSHDRRVKLWAPQSGELLQPLASLSARVHSTIVSSIIRPRSLLLKRFIGVESASNMLVKRNWLVSEGRKMLWLPDARPGCSTVYKHSIAIGCPSGRVVYIELDPSA